MKKEYFYKLFAIIITVIAVLGFNIKHDDPYFILKTPKNWPNPHYTVPKKGLLLSQIELGRVLFYDPILSKNHSISCASCHTQYQAFAHSDHRLSHGINDLIGKRNAPAIQNMAWEKRFMWDGSVHHLDVLAIAPISNPLEMDESLVNIVKKINLSKMYRKMFKTVYKDTIINSARILKSVASFLVTLNSFNSKYDQVMRKENNMTFNDSELKGYKLFKKHCVSCHQEPLFSNSQFESNGLEIDPVLTDSGRFSITKKPEDLYKFKVPTLRNIEVTYPYMHDGRYANLSMVLFHYSTINYKLPYLSKKIKKNLRRLTENDKSMMIAFLKTLTDESFLRNKKYSYPFEVLKEYQ